MKPFEKVLVRNIDREEWKAEHFSHYSEEKKRFVCGCGFLWNECIPFEGNEHLLGKVGPAETKKPNPGEKWYVPRLEKEM